MPFQWTFKKYDFWCTRFRFFALCSFVFVFVSVWEVVLCLLSFLVSCHCLATVRQYCLATVCLVSFSSRPYCFNDSCFFFFVGPGLNGGTSLFRKGAFWKRATRKMDIERGMMCSTWMLWHSCRCALADRNTAVDPDSTKTRILA
jgi:hypothetical protein